MAAPSAAPVQSSPILCLRYNGAAPPPQAADTNPSPADQWNIALQQQEQRDIAKKQQADAEAAKAKGGGFMASAGALLSKAAASVDHAYHQGTAAAERKIYDLEQENGMKEWTVYWPELAAAGDKFVVRYSCAVLSKGLLAQGTVYLSERHVSFISADGGLIKDSVGLAQVASMQRSVSLPTVQSGPPFIMVVPAPQVIPTCIQFFLTPAAGNKLWQFVDFDSVGTKASQMMGSGVCGTACERFANWADKKWRAATPVPVPGVQYATY
jgi:hypothetical protein